MATQTQHSETTDAPDGAFFLPKAEQAERVSEVNRGLFDSHTSIRQLLYEMQQRFGNRVLDETETEDAQLYKYAVGVEIGNIAAALGAMPKTDKIGIMGLSQRETGPYGTYSRLAEAHEYVDGILYVPKLAVVQVNPMLRAGSNMCTPSFDFKVHAGGEPTINFYGEPQSDGAEWATFYTDRHTFFIQPAPVAEIEIPSIELDTETYV